MKDLIVRDEMLEFMGKEIPVIVGGFGEDCRVMLASTISDIHNTGIKYINEAIKKLISKNRIKDGVHFIDLKSVDINDPLLYTFYDKEFVRKSSSIFVLSERGYSSLVKYMDDDFSWEVHDKLIDEYFIMKEYIKQTQLSVEEMVIMQAQSVMALKDEVKIMKEDVEELKQISSTTTIESYKQGIVQREVAKRVRDSIRQC